MQYTLDKSNEKGEIGRGGTSVYALEFLSNWLNENGKKKDMNIICKSIPETEISIYNKELEKNLQEGAVAIVRVKQGCDHYCLLTGIDEEYAYLFDPYYLNINYYDKDNKVEIIKDRPFEFNRKVKKTRMDERSERDFALVKDENCEMIIVKRN